MEEIQSYNIGKDERAYGEDNILSYEQIVMLSVKRVTELGSKDLCGGGMKSMTNRVIGDIAVADFSYTENPRDCFTNAIDILIDVCRPKFYLKYKSVLNASLEKNAKDMSDFYDKWLKELDEKFEQCKKDKVNQTEWYHWKTRHYRKMFSELCAYLGIDTGSFSGSSGG